MKVSLKTAFSILDGRLSTNMEDIYIMLNYIFSENLFTHNIPTALRKLKEVNPDWFKNGVEKLNLIKHIYNTNDFSELMKIIDSDYSNEEIELLKIEGQTINFTDGLFPNK